jgi:polar amino acid transport system ATP-binding protein
MSFAREVADRVVFMHDGTVAEVAPPSELFNNPQHDKLKQFLQNVK